MKITLYIQGGAVVGAKGLDDDTEIEIRDYDTQGVDPSVLEVDDEGDEYQSILIDSETFSDDDDVEEEEE